MTIRVTLALAALLTSFGTTSVRAWFWGSEKNTVKAYEDCLSRNASQITPIADIRAACAKKVAAQISPNSVVLEYKVKQNDHLLPNQRQLSYLLLDRTVSVSSKDHLLTDIVFSVTYYDEPAKQYSVSVDPGHTVSVPIEGSKLPNGPTRECNSKIAEYFNCVKVELVSAKGLQILIK